jgi:hypothetical protein
MPQPNISQQWMLSINLNQPAAIYLFTFDPFDNNRQLQIIASFMEMDSFRSQVSEEVIWQTRKDSLNRLPKKLIHKTLHCKQSICEFPMYCYFEN